MQVLMCALALNTLGSTPVEVEEVVVGEVLDIHLEKTLLGMWVSTLKPGLGQNIALVWLLRPHRSPSLLELRLNQAKTLGGDRFVVVFSFDSER